MKTRTFFLIATGVLVAATVLVLLVHFVLGLLVLRIAVGPTAETGRRSGFALAHVFSADHPRVRVSTVPVADLAASAGALDSGQVELAVVRSDLAPDTGQTVAILRRDAAFFLTSSASEIDDVSKLRGKAVGVLSTDGPTMKLLRASCALAAGPGSGRISPSDDICALSALASEQ